ncbi:hypothetical protein P3T35_003832 [Kitasatospora sp. GP30]|uniref:hypothetical protein n=1 Tax=Kitasatospora sp. GP30 TaxID=3035084 RepID=UPI000C70B7A7|nr:hypothetical protein [Kitasatospora sp. GP30]MDH6141811.1 hypothetical protein [Kitasatospora sp. GP30]
MRTAARPTTAASLLATALLAAIGPAAAATADPMPSKQGHPYSIPVGGITDLGDLTKLADLGTDLTGPLGH